MYIYVYIYICIVKLEYPFLERATFSIATHSSIGPSTYNFPIMRSLSWHCYRVAKTHMMPCCGISRKRAL